MKESPASGPLSPLPPEPESEERSVIAVLAADPGVHSCTEGGESEDVDVGSDASGASVRSRGSSRRKYALMVVFCLALRLASRSRWYRSCVNFLDAAAAHFNSFSSCRRAMRAVFSAAVSTFPRRTSYSSLSAGLSSCVPNSSRAGWQGN
jgi:hypothetical protein